MRRATLLAAAPLAAALLAAPVFEHAVHAQTAPEGAQVVPPTLTEPPLTPTPGATEVLTMRYLCDRGVEVPATYINASDTSLVVIHVDGSQITLFTEPSASGARYGWPSDGASYVWWTKGEEAFLLWSEGGEERPVLEGCRRQG